MHYPPTYRAVPAYPASELYDVAAQRAYDAYMPRDDVRPHMDESLVKKRTRQRVYPSEEAKQAAKMLQKARRREQNRNAQRRLRDRKEEHIFKLEAEVAQLRRQGEQQRAEMQGLEEMIRRLMEQRSELRHRLEALGGAPLGDDLTFGGEKSMRLAPLLSLPPLGAAGQASPSGRASRRETLADNALGLEYEMPSQSTSWSASPNLGDRERPAVSPVQSSASSASVSTPRSPSSLEPRSRTTSFHATGLRKSQPNFDLPLPRLKMDATNPILPPSLMPLPPVTAPWPHQ
ncbi:hypothetical protein PaG_04403 [Moesziomyces aphidis]|uniref:BZIP domain-containing protein n=1 Tax=Moesziomyces aphidis TaxID=84754 RepID=W3VKV0_MOEAP|nr:hypothetical protein PaG_04403 [Moesziomyces aphidis]